MQMHHAGSLVSVLSAIFWSSGHMNASWMLLTEVGDVKYAGCNHSM